MWDLEPSELVVVSRGARVRMGRRRRRRPLGEEGRGTRARGSRSGGS